MKTRKRPKLLLTNHVRAHHVESGEEPAATTGLLVGDSLRGSFVGEIGVVGLCHVRTCGESGYTRGYECILQCLAGWIIGHALAEVAEHVGSDGATLCKAGEHSSREAKCKSCASEKMM